jgi:hypothetical protein
MLLPFLTTLLLPLALTAPTHPFYPRFDPKNLTGIDIQMMTRVRCPSHDQSRVKFNAHAQVKLTTLTNETVWPSNPSGVCLDITR